MIVWRIRSFFFPHPFTQNLHSDVVYHPFVQLHSCLFFFFWSTGVEKEAIFCVVFFSLSVSSWWRSVLNKKTKERNKENTLSFYLDVNIARRECQNSSLMVDHFCSSRCSLLVDLLVKSIFRKRFAHLSSAITNRLWLNAHTNYDCDVLLTFPPRVDDRVIVWLLEQLLRLEPDIRISIKYHFTTGDTDRFSFGEKFNTFLIFPRSLWLLFDIYLYEVSVHVAWWSRVEKNLLLLWLEFWRVLMLFNCKSRSKLTSVEDIESSCSMI